jgi:hypothetical protein
VPTSDETLTDCRGFPWAGRSLFLLGFADLAHISTAIATCNTSRAGPVGVLVTAGMHGTIVALLYWLGTRVSFGKNLSPALGILSFLGFTILSAIGVGLSGTYRGGAALLVIQGFAVCSWVLAFALVFRAWFVSFEGMR